jgi:hypothetical protein
MGKRGGRELKTSPGRMIMMIHGSFSCSLHQTFPQFPFLMTGEENFEMKIRFYRFCLRRRLVFALISNIGEFNDIPTLFASLISGVDACRRNGKLTSEIKNVSLFRGIEETDKGKFASLFVHETLENLLLLFFAALSPLIAMINFNLSRYRFDSFQKRYGRLKNKCLYLFSKFWRCSGVDQMLTTCVTFFVAGVTNDWSFDETTRTVGGVANLRAS